MHSHDRNVDSELVSMCHWTVGLIKINTLTMRTPICTVACNEFPCIITVAFLNNWINERAEDLFPSGRYLIGMVAERRLVFLFLLYCRNKASLQNVSEYPLELHQCSFVLDVSPGDKNQDLKPQVWLDQILTESLRIFPLVSLTSSYTDINLVLSAWIMMALKFIKRALRCDGLLPIDRNDPHTFLSLC